MRPPQGIGAGPTSLGHQIRTALRPYYCPGLNATRFDLAL